MPSISNNDRYNIIYWPLALAIVCGLFLTSCSKPDRHDEPQLNPTPKYFLTVKGRIDPAVMENVNLVWSITYASNNRDDNKCRNVVNRFEGAIFPLYKDDSFIMQPDARGYYTYKIALDKYVPGYCEWKPLAAGYEYKLKFSDNRSFINIKFNNTPNSKHDFYRDIWRCSKLDCELIQHLNSSKYKILELNYHSNYTYAVNIEKGESR